VPDHITQTTTEPLAVDTKTAASLLNSTDASLVKDRATGHLGVPYVKAGRRVIYCLSDLKDWLSANKVTPVGETSVGDQP
jgi:hypothetical protein